MFWRRIKSWRTQPAPVAVAVEPEWGHEAQGGKGLGILRVKWGEVPFTSQERAHSTNLLSLPDADLHRMWSDAWAEQSTGANFGVRGWYYQLYRDQWRGKRVIDFGSGLGYDALTFAGAGAAEVTCVDLAPTNLEVIRRVAAVRGLTNVRTLYLKDFDSLGALGDGHDVIWAQGSLLTAPPRFARAECQALLKHLKKGGRWVELAYPKVRWEREGRLPFDQWGDRTDGGAPWMEWKDLDKVRGLLSPRRFDTVLAMEFHNSDFNWFDLVSLD
jgi:SAM-dependent methyltransferase